LILLLKKRGAQPVKAESGKAVFRRDGRHFTWRHSQQCFCRNAAAVLRQPFISQDDPEPQTIYRVAVKSGAPLLVKVGLRYSQTASRKSKR
jgi:hypothetical protein